MAYINNGNERPQTITVNIYRDLTVERTLTRDLKLAVSTLPSITTDQLQKLSYEAYDERFLLHVADFQAYIRTLSVDYSSLMLSTVNPERQNLTNCSLP